MDPYITLISAIAGSFAIIGGIAALARWAQPKAWAWWKQGHGTRDDPPTERLARTTRESGINAQSATAKKESGKLHRQNSEFPEAKQLFTQAYADFVELDHIIGQANALMNRGIAFRMTTDWSDSEKDHLESDRLYRQAGDRRSQADNLKNFGALYRDMGEYGRAIDIHEKSLGIYEVLKLTAKITELRQELAIDHAKLGHADIARNYLDGSGGDSNDANNP